MIRKPEPAKEKSAKGIKLPEIDTRAPDTRKFMPSASNSTCSNEPQTKLASKHSIEIESPRMTAKPKVLSFQRQSTPAPELKAVYSAAQLKEQLGKPLFHSEKGEYERSSKKVQVLRKDRSISPIEENSRDETDKEIWARPKATPPTQLLAEPPSPIQAASKLRSQVKIQTPSIKQKPTTPVQSSLRMGSLEKTEEKSEPAKKRKVVNTSVPTNKAPPKEFNIVQTKVDKVEFNMSFAEGKESSKDCSGFEDIGKDMTELWTNPNSDKISASIKNSFLKNPCAKLTTKLEFYKMIKLIGKGTYGKVYKAKHRLSNKFVAIKCIEKITLKNNIMVDKIFQEVNIWSQISQKNVIKLFEIFENSKFYFFVMEYVENGDLMTLLRKELVINEKLIFVILSDILDALEYLHDQNILHRDVKLDNILLSGDTAKLCDFGISAMVKPGKVFREKCGTPAYLAPEVINCCYSGFASDVR